MDLLKALRLSCEPSTVPFVAPRIALVGAGGKTTAMFQIARQLKPPVIVTATTHLGHQQTALADRWYVACTPSELPANSEIPAGVLLFTGPLDSTDRTLGVDLEILDQLFLMADRFHCPLLIEADGSRQLPLKAPADHEPAIPEFCDTVIVLAGLSALGKPLSSEWVHRSGRFSELTGLAGSEEITVEAIANYFLHPQGGLKAIPPQARRIALLNQADSPELQAAAGSIANKLLPHYDAVLVASLEGAVGQSAAPSQAPIDEVYAVYERSAGVILAAGAARRYGQPKLLLPWKGEAIIRHVARAALSAGLDPVVVVAGEHHKSILDSLVGMNVALVINPDWEKGQSSSLQVGLSALPSEIGSAVFLLGDQPQIPADLVQSLIERHAGSLLPIVAPLVGGQRANPVLFDQVTFPKLMELSGDTGGRSLFSHYPVEWLEWHDTSVLFDVDTPEDYRRLSEV